MSITTRRFNILTIAISGISALIAVISVYFTYGQLAVAVNQQKAATNQQIAATSLGDLRFVGRIAVELDESERKIRISNYSDLPLTDAALWTLGLAKNDMDDSEKLDTIRIPLSGLGACRTMTFSVDTLIGLAAAESPRSNPGKGSPESATEPFLTFRAPSGSWYTISETAVYPVDNHNHTYSVDAAKYSEPQDALPDSVLEGNISEERTVDAILPIGPAAPVTQIATGGADVTSNGCAGPVK